MMNTKKKSNYIIQKIFYRRKAADLYKFVSNKKNSFDLSGHS